MKNLLPLLLLWVCQQVLAVDVLEDLQSHCSNPGTYLDPDPVTSCHELTHGVNSDLRQKHSKPCFYALNNKFLSLPKELDTTLSSVAEEVPQELRGRIFNLYLVQQQRYWQNEPSYLFDELAAYTNGAECANQLGINDHGETAFAVEMLGYCAILVKMTGDKDAKDILLYQAKRLEKLSDKKTWPKTLLEAL
jgi:hypothetical protein